jgi:hypothetical protein
LAAAESNGAPRGGLAGDAAVRHGAHVAHNRETDRRETLAARRLALWTLPATAACWLVVVLMWSSSDGTVRAATIAALIAAAGVSARAAVTTVRFRGRWAPDLGADAPPLWLTLALVAFAVAATVAWANVIDDAEADDVSTGPILLAAAFTAGLGVTAWRHLPAARALTADLRLVNDDGSGESPPRADR